MALPVTELSFGSDWAAWVSIDRKPVEIYSVKELPELGKTTCFVEAKDGAAFQVHLRDDLPYSATDWGAAMLRRRVPHSYALHQ